MVRFGEDVADARIVVTQLGNGLFLIANFDQVPHLDSLGLGLGKKRLGVAGGQGLETLTLAGLSFTQVLKRSVAYVQGNDFTVQTLGHLQGVL